MPRSQKKKILDILSLIKNDEDLSHKFAEIIVETIRHEMFLKKELVDIISNEYARRARRLGL